ncbi:MAG: hypothetical protein J0H40_17625 [Rhizobiales bacterium]|nr:hypothetical protein [Hyphomicrobiales bacterium]
MPALTRRRLRDVHQETWCIYYGDVRVGTISQRAGVPLNVQQWGWSLGFFPKSHTMAGHRSGLASSFEEARAGFEAAWRDYLPTCTEQDFLDYRRDRASTAWKHAMWAAPALLPTQTPEGRSTCFCGAEITIAGTTEHIYACHMDMGAE